MELKRRLDFKKIFLGLYVALFAIYIIIGLQPVGAAEYKITGQLNIPGIGLVTDVADLDIVNHALETPDTIAGSYSSQLNKTLVIGHSTTVFQGLDKVNLRDDIIYNNKHYAVSSIDYLQKSEISMNKLLEASDVDTLVIMTCAGQLLEGGDATHRLILTATAKY